MKALRRALEGKAIVPFLLAAVSAGFPAVTAHSATKVVLTENGPQISEVAIEAHEADPSMFPEKKVIPARAIAPPRLRGITEEEIRSAPSGQMKDVIIVMKYQPPVWQFMQSRSDTPEKRREIAEEEIAANRTTQKRVRSVLLAVNGRIKKEYGIVNALSVRVPTRALALLMNMNEVLTIESSETYEVSPPVFNHDQLAAVTHIDANRYPLPTDPDKGKGTVIALIDNGIEEAHPDLDDTNPGSKIVFHQVFHGSGFGDYGTLFGVHGTSTAGVLAGNYTNRLTNPNAYRGIAPAAKLFNLKVDTGVGYSYEPTISAVEAAYNARVGRDGRIYKPDILVVEQQWITYDNTDPMLRHPNGYSTLSMAIDRAFEHGIVPIIPAGNHGSPLYNRYTLTVPGDARKAVTVGATVDGPTTLSVVFPNPLDPNRQVRSSSSGFGPTTDASRRVKPEVMAPSQMWAPTRTSGGYSYRGFSGTSGATPVIAGIAAVERGYNLKGLSAGYVLSYLINEGRLATPTQQEGLGLIDADNWHARVPNYFVNGYENRIGGTPWSPAYQDYKIVIPSSTDKLAVTVWWPERRDSAGVYHPSDIDLYVLNGKNGLMGWDDSSEGVFARTVIERPAAGDTYTIRVKSYNVDRIVPDSRIINGVSYADPLAFPDRQIYYLWITPIKAH